jgi:hypothetical protein
MFILKFGVVDTCLTLDMHFVMHGFTVCSFVVVIFSNIIKVQLKNVLLPSVIIPVN